MSKTSAENYSYVRVRLSVTRTLGILIILLGLFFICFFGIRAVTPRTVVPVQTDTEEDDNDIAAPERIGKNKTSSLSMVSTGAVIICASVPLFYLPYEEHCITLRFRKRRSIGNSEELTDPEFDYPDEDFDYIIDPDVRERLEKIRDENIRKKKHKFSKK